MRSRSAGCLPPTLSGRFPATARWPASYRGPEAIFRFLGRLPKETDGTYRSELVDVLASDGRAAALYRASGQRRGQAAGPRSGAALPARARFRDRGARAPVRPGGVRGVLGADDHAGARQRPPRDPLPRHDVPGAAADRARPAAAARRRDRDPSGPRPDRLRLPPLDRADPDLPRHVRGARGRDRAAPAARADVARERAPHGERRRVHPPGAGNRARGLVEHERLVDLRGHRRRVAPLEVRDHLPGPAHLQPVELRPRPLLRAARARSTPTRWRSGGARCPYGWRSRSR